VEKIFQFPRKQTPTFTTPSPHVSLTAFALPINTLSPSWLTVAAQPEALTQLLTPPKLIAINFLHQPLTPDRPNAYKWALSGRGSSNIRPST